MTQQPRKPLADVTNQPADLRKASGKRSTSELEDQQPKRPRLESLMCREDSLIDAPEASDEEDSETETKESFSVPIIEENRESYHGDSEQPLEEEDMFDQNNLRYKDQMYRPRHDIWTVQRVVRPEMRAVLIDWLYEVSESYSLQTETAMIAVNYVDRFLAIESISIERLQLLGITALFIAAKFQEIVPVAISEMVSLCADDQINEKAIIEMEVCITTRLGWNLSPPTSFTWLRMFLESCRMEDTPFPYSTLMQATLNIQHLLMMPESLTASAGLIAASAFWLYAPIDATEEDIEGITGFSVEEMRPIVQLLELMQEIVLKPQVQENLKECIMKKGDNQVYNPTSLDFVQELIDRQ